MTFHWLPYSGNFREHKFSRITNKYASKKKFRDFYFRDKIISDHTPAYQSLSVAVGEELPCQRERANSEDLFAAGVMTGEL